MEKISSSKKLVGPGLAGPPCMTHSLGAQDSAVILKAHTFEEFIFGRSLSCACHSSDCPCVSKHRFAVLVARREVQASATPKLCGKCNTALGTRSSDRRSAESAGATVLDLT